MEVLEALPENIPNKCPEVNAQIAHWVDGHYGGPAGLVAARCRRGAIRAPGTQGDGLPGYPFGRSGDYDFGFIGGRIR
ncbi:hypothetical protein GCM10012279_39740 [Micromonospora yangpuensis]|nr:hypothetical protein GCM10012279_39740 [Micromonospora yangpuensis]